MLLYFVIIVFCLIFEFLPVFCNEKIKIIISLIIGIFLCFGYMTGSDWRAYEVIYYDLDIKEPLRAQVEYGYQFYMFLFRLFSVDFWTFFITTKVILYAINIRFLMLYNKDKFYFTLAFFISFFGLSLFIDNPMRNLIAVSIFLFSIKYLIQRRFIKYILIILFASLFHISTILIFPLYWLVKLSLGKKKLIAVYILFNILLWVFDAQLRSLFNFETGITFIDSKISFYFGDNATGSIYTENRIFSLGLMVRFLLFFVLVYSEKQIKDRFGIVFFNLVILSFFFHRLGIGIPLFGRFLFFVSIPFAIVMIDLINSFEMKSRPFYAIFVALITFYTTYTTITLDYKYIPYTNYLTYIMKKEKPSYYERSMYNFRNSPYAK